MAETLSILIPVCLICNTCLFVGIGLDIKDLKRTFNLILDNVKAKEIDKDE